MHAAERYRRAGVDIAAGDSISKRALAAAAKTHFGLAMHGAKMLKCAGGFAAAVQLQKPDIVLLAAADGVGTKVELARENDAAEVIGNDVVAMCVNDILCAGGYPLLFLDYYAGGKLRPAFAARVMDGIAAACVEAGCALVGGETAEMPGVYEGDKIDVAGFAIGIASKESLFDAAAITPGDRIIALPSAGAHSNGYALINRILQNLDDKTMRAQLLHPTKLYCAVIRKLRAEVQVKALAHITGGGVAGNIARLVPPKMRAVVEADSFARPAVFDFLRAAGDIGESEMWNVFNCGIGMAVFVSPENEKRALQTLHTNGEAAWTLGYADAMPRGGEKNVLIKGI
ncbi:MAG: phosphoribosylformylglycinamidine cyclo-ligase [Gammaproteobacteria bacterium]